MQKARMSLCCACVLGVWMAVGSGCAVGEAAATTTAALASSASLRSVARAPRRLLSRAHRKHATSSGIVAEANASRVFREVWDRVAVRVAATSHASELLRYASSSRPVSSRRDAGHRDAGHRDAKRDRVEADPLPPYDRYERWRRRASRGPRVMKIVGWSLFGSGYLTSGVIGAIGLSLSNGFVATMLIPLAGPLIAGTYALYEGLRYLAVPSAYSVPLGFLLLLAGVGSYMLGTMQIAGFAIALIGHRRSRIYRRRYSSRSVRWAITPWATPGGGGIAAFGVF